MRSDSGVPSQAGKGKWCFILICLWLLSSIPVISQNTSGITIKIHSITPSYDQVKQKDVIKITLSSNLPGSTILKIRLITTSLLRVEDRKIVEREINSCLAELSPNGSWNDNITGLPYKLPIGVYRIKVDVFERQRKEVAPKVPKDLLGKTISEEKFIIGSGLKELITLNQSHFSDLENIWSFYESTMKDLNYFIDLYTNQKLKSEEKKLKEWHKQTTAKMFAIRQKINTFLEETYPGWYRCSFNLARDISVRIANDENTLANLVTPPEPQYTEGGTSSLPPDFKKYDTTMEKERAFLVKETIFEMVRILKYFSDVTTFRYEAFKSQRDPKSLWEKEDLKGKLTDFDNYFTDFKKQYLSNKLTPYYEIVSQSRESVGKLLEFYTNIINEGETPSALAAIQEITSKMNILLTNALEIIKEEPATEEKEPPK